MKFLLLFLLFFGTIISLKSQCFEIESILVDACSNPEQENEMVRFKIGSTPLNTNNLSVVWATTANPWNGICQNATTASKVAIINSTIQNCGYLKEPVGDILPANAQVLLITSTNYNTSSANFSNLTDTMYVIFHCNGTATSGHFGNHTSSGTKTLTMSFSSPASCSDVVTYNTSLLTQGSTSTNYDGGTVEYTPLGTATYVNYGCQAPIGVFSIDAGIDKVTCANAPQTFTASASGYNSILWSTPSNALGSLSTVNSLTTTYTPANGESGIIKLYCTISKSCSSFTTTVKDSVNLIINSIPQASIIPQATSLCSGQSTILSYSITNSAVTGTNNIVWLPTNQTTPTISVNSTGVYSLNVTNSCGSSIATTTINTSSIPPTLSITASSSVICTGQTSTLSLLGSIGNYNWNNGATTQTTAINLPGVYSATVTNGCGTANAFVTISSVPPATVSISAITPTICSGQNILLTAQSNVSNFSWSTGSTTPTISVNTQGIKTVSVSNQCGTTTATINIVVIAIPVLTVSANTTTLCPNETTILTVTGGNQPYIWSNIVSTTPTVTASGGFFTVSNTNSCGTGSTSITINTIMIDATINASPNSGPQPLEVNFSNNNSSNNTYSWVFGNGNTSSNQNPIAQTYTLAGDYMAYLTVTNGNCTDTDSILISVLNENPSLIVPNVFSPNGDGVNDVFKVAGFYITDFEATIYDRWGLKLFTWNDISKGWDGKVNGKNSADGSYFYLINGKDISDKKIEKQGSLLLIR